mmetsp:Transcript_11846/g.30362  ORF Transcript_11846/g.30362 Transcript_11846/m.30362 type:complete len:181 (+) Transcript_11846:91-633(+)
MKARAPARAAGACAGRAPAASRSCGRLPFLVLLQALVVSAAAPRPADAAGPAVSAREDVAPLLGDDTNEGVFSDMMSNALENGGSMLAEPLLLVSFMVLRGAIALRSVHDKAPMVMWQGVAFALASRCVAAGVLDPDFLIARIPALGSEDVAAMVVGVVREFLHLYGLTALLRNFEIGCR